MTRPAQGALAAASLAVAVGVAGCGGATGTFALELVTAPGSTVLDGVARARLTLSQPYRQVEATRGADGKFHLALDVPADGPSGQLTFEGFDAGGAVIAWGRSGVLPIAAVDATVAIYVAAPDTLAAAPVALDPPRSEIGVARFGFGLVLVGGAGAGGAPLDDVDVYDVYSHTLTPGAAAPAPRAGAAVGAGVTGYAYAFGGRGAGGPAGTFWRFDTTVAPSGAWLAIDDAPTLARTGAVAAPVRTDAFVVTGTPPLVMDGLVLSTTPLSGAPPFAGTATSVQLGDDVYTMIVGDGSGETGLVILGPTGLTERAGLSSATRTGHGAAATRADAVVVIGGALAGLPTATAIIADPAHDMFTEMLDVLAIPRTGAAIAGNGDVLIVAGGRDASGTLLGDAEVFDLATLTPLGSVPMVVPRRDATAAALTTGQLLILGGVDADGAPVGTIEIYTPPAP